MNSLEDFCQNWALEDPKLIATTFTSQIYKVRFQNADAILKILNEKGQIFESRGALVLRSFGGHGAVNIFKAEPRAHLLEFADGRQLKYLVDQGHDDLATQIICGVIQKLHSFSGQAPSELISMERHFRSLFARAKGEAPSSLFAKGAKLARQLVDSAQELKLLHGDIHHENIIESSKRGWLAIDPQCVVGERTYDVANTFHNPNGFGAAATSERIARRCEIFAKELNLNPKRILQFAFVHGCLSAAWSLEDGQDPSGALKTASVIANLFDL